MYSNIHTLALKQSLYRYFGAKVDAIWVHGPLGFRTAQNTSHSSTTWICCLGPSCIRVSGVLDPIFLTPTPPTTSGQKWWTLNRHPDIPPQYPRPEILKLTSTQYTHMHQEPSLLDTPLRGGLMLGFEFAGRVDKF